VTGDEARELFSEAFEGELDEARQAAFEEAVAADPVLRAEWEEFRALLEETRALGLGVLRGEAMRGAERGGAERGGEETADEDDDLDLDDPEALREFLEGPEPVDAPDLLGGVQRKIRERSRGRYYRDRFAERQRPKIGWRPLILAMLMVLVLGIAWAGLHYVEVQVGEDGAAAD